MEIRDRTFEREVPRQWHARGRAVTAFFDNLSIFFPAGERFFIASVNRFRQFGDPTAVREFTQQEANHTREHLRYNQRLLSEGFPVDEMEARVERILKRVSRRAPASAQLAVTCALEHFTALLAQMLLEESAPLEEAHPEMAALWRWHATEEWEHRAVAFDVYQASGGTWLERTWTMIGATVIFWAKVIEQQLRFMRAEKILFNPREWASLLNFLFLRPGPLRKLIPPYLGYYRRGFHP
jgi:predicted metal-dependent hydrolase